MRILLEHQAPGEEGLQSNGPKAVLDTGVVFGRSYGAASTTLSGEKTFGKTHANQKENITKYKAELRAPPPAAPCHKKASQRAQRQPRRAEGNQKGGTRTPKRPQRSPKVAKRPPKASPNVQKSEEKLENESKAHKQVFRTFLSN